jgi:hypothetical protein
MMKVFLAVLFALAPLANLRVAEIEPVEFYLLAALPLGAVFSWRRGRPLAVPRDLFDIARLYGGFLAAATILAALAWRFDFYPPPGVSWLKTPPIISFVRILQVALAVAALIAVATAAARSAPLADFLARLYIAIALVQVVYGAACWLAIWRSGAAAATPELNWYGAQTRWGVIHARGCFVEGGPFGVYLASAIVLLLFRYRVTRRVARGSFWITLAALAAGLGLSRSKAGLCTLVALGVCGLIMWGHSGVARKGAAALGAAALLVPLVYATRTIKGIGAYLDNYQALKLKAEQNPFDGSTVEGRLAALYVAPAMIVRHPLAGVGLGNYSELRNSPLYTGDLAPAPGWDEPGLGFFGYAAELGLPLLGFLMFVVWTPVRIAHRRGERGEFALALCAFQFFAELFGTPITFYYPYLISALALGHVMRERGGGEAL